MYKKYVCIKDLSLDPRYGSNFTIDKEYDCKVWQTTDVTEVKDDRGTWIGIDDEHMEIYFGVVPIHEKMKVKDV